MARTLEALPPRIIEPIVAVNGSSDRTAAIAESFGARVLNFSEQGKLPAIQKTLEYLGNSALQPLIILDADTRPLIPRLWHKGMMGNLLKDDDRLPVAVGGPIWFTSGGIVDDAVKSLRRLQRAHQSRVWDGTMRVGQCGPNMGLHMKNRGTLEQVLELPHLWPGGDLALIETITTADGHYYQPISPGMLTLSPASESYPSFIERIRIGSTESRKRIQAAYVERSAPGAIPYQSNAERRRQAETT